jgi:hypothetical protein
MRIPTVTVFAAIVTCASIPALSQDNAYVLLNAQAKGAVCVAIADACTEGAFLVQGQRTELRVINRRFLTNYVFFIDNAVAVVDYPIEDLDEAANLSLSTLVPAAASKGLAPKGLSGSSSLSLRTVQDIITELMNPQSASRVATELTSDIQVIRHDEEKVHADLQQFVATWESLDGRAAPGPNCALESPTLQGVKSCLTSIIRQEHASPWTTLPFTNEDAFRDLIVTNNDAIALVKALNALVGQKAPLLTSSLSALQADIIALRGDLNVLSGNINAVTDALVLTDEVIKPRTPLLTRAQIKSNLIAAYGSGTTPAADAAELNVMTDELLALSKTKNAPHLVTEARQAIQGALTDGRNDAVMMTAHATGVAGSMPLACGGQDKVFFQCFARSLDQQYSQAQETAESSTNDSLIADESNINQLQTTMLTRTNFIYDHSQVQVPLQRAIDLSGHPGNLRLYATIYENETFKRYDIPNVSSTAPVATGTALSASVPADTAVAPTTPPTPLPHPAGTPIAVPVVPVHDRYHGTMVAAFAFSSVKEQSIQSRTITTGDPMPPPPTPNPPPNYCASNTCSQPYFQLTSHSSVILGLAYHPIAYDTFPGYFSRWRRPRDFERHFGIFGGLSVQNMNDYYIGGNVQITRGVQVVTGLNVYRQTAIDPNYSLTGIYKGTPAFPGGREWTKGAFFGIGLNLSIFRKAFGSVTGVGTQAKTGGS